MTRRPAAALVALVTGPVLALLPGPARSVPAATPAPTASTAQAAQTAPAGAAGIGDPYWPLDGNGGIDVLRYDVHDRYRFGTGRLSGRTTVTLRATATLSRFDLDLLLPTTSVTVDGRPVPFEHRHHELVVDHGLVDGQVARVGVRYAGRPGRLGYAGERSWLASRSEVVAMNQPHMAPWWFPANDHPRDRAMVRTSITVPKDQQVVANGRRLGRVVHGGLATTTWRAEEPMVPYLAFFAAGHFAVDSGTRDGRPWTVAVSRTLGTAQQRTAMDLMRRTPRLVEWLEQQLGAAYPFSVTGGLTTGLDPSFALENQTRPTYPYLGSSPWAVRTVVHELAHQWFGDSVAVDQWRDTWLNEGTATFFERRWTETHGGQTAARWLRQAYDDMDADDGFWHHQVAEPCPSHASCVDSIFASWVYDRGAMTLQALRNLVGEGDFWEVLRRWAVERAGRTGDTAAFEALAEQVSGRDLGGFFEAWLHTARKPADTEANGLGPLSPAAARPPAR